MPATLIYFGSFSSYDSLSHPLLSTSLGRLSLLHSLCTVSLCLLAPTIAVEKGRRSFWIRHTRNGTIRRGKTKANLPGGLLKTRRETRMRCTNVSHWMMDRRISRSRPYFVSATNNETNTEQNTDWLAAALFCSNFYDEEQLDSESLLVLSWASVGSEGVARGQARYPARIK